MRTKLGKKKALIVCYNVGANKQNNTQRRTFMSKSILAQPMAAVNQLEIEKGTGEVLVDISSTGRVRPWNNHKSGNERIVKLYQRANEMLNDLGKCLMSDNSLQRLQDCSTYLLFNRDEHYNKQLDSANFCRVRLCPMCAWRRSLKLFSQVSMITDAILHDNKKARFLFITLTLKNVAGADLKNALDDLNNAFALITNNSRTFAPAKKFKKSLLGYMKAIEITYNAATDTYHPHIHVIFEVRSDYFREGYIEQFEWTELWKRALKVQYTPIVDVRAIIGRTAKAVAEVAKYPVKFDTVLKIDDMDVAANALIELHRAISGRRLVTFGGDFRAYKRKLALDDIENGDFIHVDDDVNDFNAVAQVLYKWHAGCGAYIC